MRVRATILLLLANIVVAFLIFRIEGEREYKPAIAAPLFPSDIQSISVEGPGALPYTLERHQRGWRITAPFLWEAGPAADYIAEQLRFLRTDRGFSVEEAQANGSTLGSFGLDKPAARLVVRGGAAGEKPVIVEIGLLTFAGGDARVTLLTPDKRILPVERKFYETLVVPPNTLRSNTVFDIEQFQIRSVAVRMPAPTPAAPERQIRIASETRPIPNSPDTERLWRFEAPFDAEASLPLTDAAIARLAALRIQRFLPPAEIAAPRRPLGLNPPALRLTLEGNGHAQTLLLGSRDPQSPASAPACHAKLSDNDAIFTVPETILPDWRDAAKRLREREFLRFHPDQLAEIIIHGPNGDKLALQRRASGEATPEKITAAAAPANPADELYADWNIPALPGTTATATLPADPGQMHKLILDTLRHIAAIPQLSGDTPANMMKYCEAYVTDFPTPADLATLGFDKPARRVELRFKDGSKTTLLLAAPIAKGTPWHALVEGKNQTIHSVEKRIAEELTTSPQHYRHRLIGRLLPGAILTAIKITDLADNATLFHVARAPADATLAPAIAALPPAERAPAAALAAQLAHVRTRAYLPGPFTQELRHAHPYAQTPAQWRYRLDISHRPPGAKTDETRSLYLTPRLGGTLQIAGARLRNCLFELEQPLIDALYPLTHLKTDPKDIPVIVPPPALPPAPPAAAPAPAVQR